MTKNFRLKKELKKDFLSSGAINAIILGVHIMEPLSFTLLLKRTRMVF